jgi:hypothetical protein
VAGGGERTHTHTNLDENARSLGNLGLPAHNVTYMARSQPIELKLGRALKFFSYLGKMEI